MSSAHESDMAPIALARSMRFSIGTLATAASIVENDEEDLERFKATLAVTVRSSTKCMTSNRSRRSAFSSSSRPCAGCVEKGFPLAGIVMIGGLLEALLLTRVNLLTDKEAVFKAAAAPKDKLGKTLHLKDWGLKDFIDVACELKWITETHKDVSVILRDYRNYIHPHKEYQHRKRIEASDAGLLWDVGKNMLRQLLKIS